MMLLTPDSLAWYVCVFVFYLTKVAVPVFFMISGYTMLHKKDDWTKTGKRFVRVLLALIVFSLVYYVQRCVNFGLPFRPLEFLQMLWKAPLTDAFWYLYLYLGIILMIPFLQRMVAGMEEKDYKVFFFLAILTQSILPVIPEFWPQAALNADFAMPLLTCCISYPVLGHWFYLHRTEGAKKSIPSWCLLLIVVGTLAINIGVSGAEWRATGGEHFLSLGQIEYLPLMAESVCVFALFLRIAVGEKLAKLAQALGACTFGVYLLADFVVARTHMIYYYSAIYMNRLLAMLLQVAAALVLGYLLTWILRKIPGIRKLL